MDGETLKAVLSFIQGLGLTKWQVLIVFVLCLVTWRLPVLLQHRKEMRVAKDDFKLRSDTAREKIALEREKRVRRLNKGGKQ